MKGKIVDFWFKPVPSWRYSIVRKTFAALSLFHLVELWPYRLSFFSAQGMNDQDAIIAISECYLSIFALIESKGGVEIVFGIVFLSNILLFLGKFPRVAIAIVYLFYVSLVARIGPGLTGWDMIMSNFAFLLLISPLGVSSTGKSVNPAEVPRYGLILMQLQVFVIYWQTVLNRLDDEYWQNGYFFYYFVQSAYSKVAGTWAIDASSALRFLTWGTQLIELAIPVLLLFRKTVWFGVILGAFLHLSIGFATDHLFLFSVTMLMTYLCFIRDYPSGWLIDQAVEKWKGFRSSN